MLKHLDYLMISNGGCDPFHYLKGNGALGYKPHEPYIHGVGRSYEMVSGRGFEKEFPEITSELQEADEEEDPEEVYKNVLVNEFTTLQDDEDKYLDKELNDSKIWLDIYNEGIKQGFFNNDQSIHDKAKEVTEYHNHLFSMKNDLIEKEIERHEKENKIEQEKLEDLELEQEEKEMIEAEPETNDIWKPVTSIPEDNLESLMNGRRGYDFYNEMKRKYNINLANGLGYEEIQNEPELKELIAKYTGDDSDIVDQKNYFFSKLMPTEELEDEWDKRGLDPLKYLPSDSSNDSSMIEKKNYIGVKGEPGEYIDPKVYKEIVKLQKEGKSPDEIEQIFKSSGREVPTLPITESKLSGFNSNGKPANIYHYFKKDPTTGEIYLEKIIWNDLIPDAKGKTLVQAPTNYPIWKGRKGFIYDMLIDNARVIYNPLKDTNLTLSGGRFSDQGKYKSYLDKRDKKKYYRVPITRMDIHIKK